MALWSTFELHKDGQTDWLVRLYEKTVNGMRDIGLPSEINDGVLSVRIPTLAEQARVMRRRDIRPPGHNAPSGVLSFTD